ncbi:superoxide dismutase family protein [uncultured Marivita sp.]|uniref:superoxide dismutase family protein n=1 Tax=uncultured Marivita sp. TaxID=888080 RepID=UPI002607BA99|nr:superoxide dismutase family protein [uncultured Marivita sp.]
MKHALFALSLSAVAATPLHAQDIAAAEVQNRDGESVGSVYLRDTASGYVRVIVALTDLPEGGHGLHIHETGDCSADDFSSAGGHLAGDAAHGVMTEDGPHPGDLPNLIVHSDGTANVEHFNNRLEIENMIFDEDGAAIIVHSGQDDYTSQPSGDAGDRIACGAFVRRAEADGPASD